MSCKEELNFFKISSLLLDVASAALSERIKVECVKNNQSFENFLNSLINKDSLLHLWQPVRCCNTHCSKSRTKSIINDVQWKQLYKQTSNAGHIKRNAAGKICQSCIHVYTAVHGVTPDSCDITLCSCLLINICGLSASEKTSIQKIRELRNSVFAHAKGARIADTDFNNHWRDIETEILSISSVCDSTVQNRLNTKIADLKQLNYIDPETHKAILNKVLFYLGQELSIIEKIDDVADSLNETINTNTPQYKVQKITEAEVSQPTLFISTRVLDAGIDSLLENGIVIFTGKCGSGKTSTSLEIMKRVQEGKLLLNYKIQHVSIENWDLQVDINQESLIFLEDPLGTINANYTVIKQDQGLFRKVYVSVKSGKVKVILTIRSNIYQEHKDFLERHDIFQEKFIVDLSNGANALNEREKKQFLNQYCEHSTIVIVSNCDEIETETDQPKPIKLSQKTIQQIVDSDPPIGFPLCCKRFFQCRGNICLGARFFIQPTDILLKEMKDMMLSKDENLRKNAGLLIYMTMSRGKIDFDNIDYQKINTISKALEIHPFQEFHLRICLNELIHKQIKSVSDSQYEICHATDLESIFFTCCTNIPMLIPDMLMNIDIKVLCEIVRTNNCGVRKNETILMLQKKGKTLQLTVITSVLKNIVLINSVMEMLYIR